MKGTLHNTADGWIVRIQDKTGTHDVPLHPDDVERFTKGVVHFADEPVEVFLTHEYPESCQEDPFCMGDETCILCLKQYAKIK